LQLHRGKWGNDRIKKTMEILDTGSPKATASLPWELLVTGKELVSICQASSALPLCFPT